MLRSAIPVDHFSLPVIQTIGSRWMLLTAGTFAPGQFNCMTVSWGGLGVLWNKPMAMVVVRPSRHTFTFMEAVDSFTLCVFPPEYRDALTLCGTCSGRAVDKIKETGLTPVASTQVPAPSFDEAELVLECRKMYSADLDPQRFHADHIEANYKGRDYHRVYVAEIVALFGTAAYRC